MDDVVAALEELQTPKGNGSSQSKLGNTKPQGVRRHHADDAKSRNRLASAYPRPSASPKEGEKPKNLKVQKI